MVNCFFKDFKHFNHSVECGMVDYFFFLNKFIQFKTMAPTGRKDLNLLQKSQIIEESKLSLME